MSNEYANKFIGTVVFTNKEMETSINGVAMSVKISKAYVISTDKSFMNKVRGIVATTLANRFLFENRIDVMESTIVVGIN